MDSHAKFRNFDQCRANELIVTRIGFWRARYVLSDGVFCYGELSRAGAMTQDMIIETASGKWLVKKASLFSSETNIFNAANNEIAGLLLSKRRSNKVTLTMADDGFTASFIKPNLFSCAYSWLDESFTRLINITQVFNYSKPFKLGVDQTGLRMKMNTPLVMLLGLQIILLKQPKAAAH